MTKKYKIGVNGWFFCKPFTGIGRYSINIYSEIARLFPELEFYIAIPERLSESIDKTLRYQNNIKFELLEENKAMKFVYPGISKSFWERNQLKKFFKDNKVDLIHHPYPALYKKDKEIPLVITIHDTIPWTDKDYGSRNILSKLYNGRTLESALRADLILTVSESAKEEILAFSEFSDETVKVAYNAADFDEPPKQFSEQWEKLKKKINLNGDDRYLLFLGGYDKRKNVARMIDIYIKYIEPKTDLKLVMGGGNVLENELFGDFKLLKQHKNIITTGFLTNEELIPLYRNAWAYFSLTTREGFNLTLLEALTLRCPVLISDLKVHREVADDVPLFLNLESTDEEIANSILDLYNNTTKYRDLLHRTESFAEKVFDRYSWKESAKVIGNLYYDLLT